jgi:hypothetical protein
VQALTASGLPVRILHIETCAVVSDTVDTAIISRFSAYINNGVVLIIYKFDRILN